MSVTPYTADEVMLEVWIGGQRERVLATVSEVERLRAEIEAMRDQAADAFDAAQAVVADKSKSWAALAAEKRAALELRAEAERVRDSLLDSLLRYGGHDPGCRWPNLTCECGFAGILTRAILAKAGRTP